MTYASNMLERIARLETQMEGAREDIKEGFRSLEQKLEKMRIRLDKAEDEILKAKVGWKTLVTVGGFLTTAAGAVGAFAAKFLPFLGSAPR